MSVFNLLSEFFEDLEDSGVPVSEFEKSSGVSQDFFEACTALLAIRQMVGVKGLIDDDMPTKRKLIKIIVELNPWGALVQTRLFVDGDKLYYERRYHHMCFGPVIDVESPSTDAIRTIHTLYRVDDQPVCETRKVCDGKVMVLLRNNRPIPANHPYLWVNLSQQWLYSQIQT